MINIIDWNVMVTGIVIICAVSFLIGFISNYICEKRDYNGGYCKHCGRKLRHRNIDSSGAREYKCDNCGYNVWVSYNVDKYYEE